MNELDAWRVLVCGAVFLACSARPDSESGAPGPSRPPSTEAEPTPAEPEAAASQGASPSNPLPSRRPPPDVGYPRLTVIERDLAADEGYSTEYEIAANGAFHLHAAGSTGGAEIQGQDCVGSLTVEEVEPHLERVAAAATVSQPPRGRSIQDAVDQDIWKDYTIGYSTDASTIRYVVDSDRWAKDLTPLMTRVREADSCTHYRETR